MRPEQLSGQPQSPQNRSKPHHTSQYRYLRSQKFPKTKFQMRIENVGKRVIRGKLTRKWIDTGRSQT